MSRGLFSSRHRIAFLSICKFVNPSSAVNHIHVSRRTEACFSRVFSSDSAGNVVAGMTVGGLNPTATATGQGFEGIEDANGEAILRSSCGVKILTAEQKKMFKLQQNELRKAEIVAANKERRRNEGEKKQKAWDEKLDSVSDEERLKLIEERRHLRMETIKRMNEDKAEKIKRLEKAREHGQNIVIDLEFCHLMSPLDIKSLTRQIMFCYAANGKSSSPGHLWLTGCRGDMETQLLKIPGYEKWIIEKEKRSYYEAFKERKDDLIYMTPDSENILGDVDPNKVYILGGLVDRTRQKGVTIKKAKSQRIQTARLPIREYLKESSCQILAINQVIELLLKFNETRDWKTSFFHAVPQRKQSQA